MILIKLLREIKNKKKWNDSSKNQGNDDERNNY